MKRITYTVTVSCEDYGPRLRIYEDDKEISNINILGVGSSNGEKVSFCLTEEEFEMDYTDGRYKLKSNPINMSYDEACSMIFNISYKNLKNPTLLKNELEACIKKILDVKITYGIDGIRTTCFGNQQKYKSINRVVNTV